MFIEKEKIHKSWLDFFTKDIENELENVEKQIGKNYFPRKENVLRFMQLDLNKVKYIIVGMEPYPSSYIENNQEIPEATGRSFEVSSVKSWNQKFKQSSLRNILKTIYFNKYNVKISLNEIREKITNKEFKIKEPKEWFDSLENQGILFLNATLTVEPNNVDSHCKIWENFMNELIVYILNRNENIKWLLWGNKAQTRILPLVREENVICSCHPRLASFVDENCFQYIKNINFEG